MKIKALKTFRWKIDAAIKVYFVGGIYDVPEPYVLLMLLANAVENIEKVKSHTKTIKSKHKVEDHGDVQ